MKKNNRRAEKNQLVVKVLKRANGRPPKYDEESLWVAAQGYFKICSNKMFPTKSGICLWLDISRETYSQYLKQFPDTIKKINFIIEDWWVQRLTKQGAVGSIFYLKNAFKDEYKDRTDHDLTTGGQPITGMRITKDK